MDERLCAGRRPEAAAAVSGAAPPSTGRLEAPPAAPRREAGPAPAMPLMCFRCVTSTCGHRDKIGSTHGGGLVPAITMKYGTAMCLNCATEAR